MIHATWMRITSFLRRLGTPSSATVPMTPWAMSRMVEAVSMEWRNRHTTPPSMMMMANPGGKVISLSLQFLPSSSRSGALKHFNHVNHGRKRHLKVNLRYRELGLITATLDS